MSGVQHNLAILVIISVVANTLSFVNKALTASLRENSEVAELWADSDVLEAWKSETESPSSATSTRKTTPLSQRITPSRRGKTMPNPHLQTRLSNS